MNILTVDVGGTHVKVLATNQAQPRKINSGPSLTAAQMVAAVKQATADWAYDVVSIGYPGPVIHGVPARDPVNLGPGWVGFDFVAAFGRPVRIINDAAMQALGSYVGGRMLFLGLGTGLGTAMVIDGVLEPMELGHLPYKRRQTYEDFIGLRGLRRLGKKAWRLEVQAVVALLCSALQPDYVVLGGGNAKHLKELPEGARLGDNANAFKGGFRLWSAPTMAGALPAAPAQRPRGELTIFDSGEDVQRAAAELFVQAAQAATSERGRFLVALSGGSTPRGLFRMLAEDEHWRSQVPWDACHFFWGDERHVPPDDPESNFRMAHETLLSRVPVPSEQIHRIHAENPDASQAAAEYEAELRAVFGVQERQPPRFDLLMLGLGPEAHTASLFPGTRALGETEHTVVANWVGKFFTHRITLTVPVINNAACIMFLVTGDEKALAFKAVLDGPYEPDQLPAQLVQPTQGRLVWLADRPAAHALNGAP